MLFKIFADADFLYLKLLMAHLGSSWPLLGPIWAQKNPQNCPKSNPTIIQKLFQKITPTNVKNNQILAPKIGNLGEAPQQAQPAGTLLKALVSKMAAK